MTSESSVLAGVWNNFPLAGLGSVAHAAGYRLAVLDYEHGVFTTESAFAQVQQLKAEGVTVFVKPGTNTRWFVQQALDHGADGVIIPHVEGAVHAAEIAGYTKFAPDGTRSAASGTQTRFRAVGHRWMEEENARVLCIPMIERATALEQIEDIVAEENVDGIFIGSADLSLSRGRGAYARTAEDFADFARIAAVCVAAGKPWGIGGWVSEEREFARAHGATWIVTCMDFTALEQGMRLAIADVPEAVVS
ncbi:aldolase/citrate lyase family protein [Microbacterium pseudoresistens]|uniref:4-hydroxy-2-oxoheptanedioate aldolase n=1 Tax=Microbacterium pseudoresistens TaxID=640634 RepID=A0A7Y9JNA9_9MICO|nr:aldolase/citrate lyase family protein [Microbacterium pseudoresistens]NYD54368.1 4-hydroxy-2-oxoheptanedioate aldolase [Microbacterium pseudoresistens]